MQHAPEWVLLGSVSTVLEAELVQQTLEAEEIPVIFRGNHSGIHGGAYQGPVAGGLELLVPAAALARARELVVLDAT